MYKTGAAERKSSYPLMSKHGNAFSNSFLHILISPSCKLSWNSPAVSGNLQKHAELVYKTLHTLYNVLMTDQCCYTAVLLWLCESKAKGHVKTSINGSDTVATCVHSHTMYGLYDFADSQVVKSTDNPNWTIKNSMDLVEMLLLTDWMSSL